MDEREKMLAGELYDTSVDKGLEEERYAAKDLCQAFNSLKPSEVEARSNIIKKLFGRTGNNVVIEQNFWCDYGYNIMVRREFLYES